MAAPQAAMAQPVSAASAASKLSRACSYSKEWRASIPSPKKALVARACR